MAFLSRLLGGKKAVENKHPRAGNASIAAHPPRAFPVPRTFPTEAGSTYHLSAGLRNGHDASLRVQWLDSHRSNSCFIGGELSARCRRCPGEAVEIVS